MNEDRKWGTCTQCQYYSDVKKDEIMPFPVTGKKLEIIILSEVKAKDKSRVSLPAESKHGCK